MLHNKTVLVGITGGIAAYKACDIVSSLIKHGANVQVIMTKNATEFVQPLTFESLTGNEVVSDMFSRGKEWEIEHISLAQQADIFVVVPATANVIAKFANGIADDMLTTTYIACNAPKVICPAMNTAMYDDITVKDNLAKLNLQSDTTIIDPAIGRLACGDTGKGKLADVNVIVDKIIDILMPIRDYVGSTVLVTAGATRENIDRARFISNYSSGKMGIEIARAAMNRGAKVVLVYGNISVDIPKGIHKAIKVISTEDMYNAVMAEYKSADYIIKAAAPADYTIKPFDKKVKSEMLNLQLIKTTDIAKEIGKVKGNRKLIIFSAETNDLLINAKTKLKSKSADMVVANDITQEGAGFDVDTNIITIITSNKEDTFDKMSKIEVANIILDYAHKL